MTVDSMPTQVPSALLCAGSAVNSFKRITTIKTTIKPGPSSPSDITRLSERERLRENKEPISSMMIYLPVNVKG